MSAFSKRSIWAILCLFLFATELKAQYLDFSGTCSYSVNGTRITLGAERIDHFNNPYQWKSGTLYLQLWTCLTPYDGINTSLGYKVAQATLDPLLAGYFYSNVVRTVSFIQPPDGTYYMVMVLAESDGTQPLTVDWFNFPQRQTFRKTVPDTTSPTLQITSPRKGAVKTSKGHFLLRGKAKDNISPTLIEVRVKSPGRRGFGKWKGYSLPSKSKPVKRWRISLPVKIKGKWKVELRARDASGNYSIKQIRTLSRR